MTVILKMVILLPLKKVFVPTERKKGLYQTRDSDEFGSAGQLDGRESLGDTEFCVANRGDESTDSLHAAI